MGLERYIIDAVVLERRDPRELARLHGISKSWIYALFAASAKAATARSAALAMTSVVFSPSRRGRLGRRRTDPP
jgi:hypothetical protein